MDMSATTGATPRGVRNEGDAQPPSCFRRSTHGNGRREGETSD